MTKRAKTIGVVIGLSVVLAPFCLYTIYESATSARRSAVNARLRAVGYPATYQEYLSTRPNAERNGLAIVDELIKKWDAIEAPFPRRREPALIRPYLAQVSPFFPKLDVLANSEMWSEPNRLGFPSSTKMKTWATALSYSLQDHAERGEVEAAKKDLIRLRSLERLLCQHGDFISALSGMAVGEIGDHAVIRASTASPDLSTRQMWRKLFQETKPELNLVRATRYDHISFLKALAEVDRDLPEPSWDAGLMALRVPALMRRMEVLYLESVADVAERYQDGVYDNAESLAVDKMAAERMSRERAARPLIERFGIESAPGLRNTHYAAKRRAVLTCLDVAIEQAGGPKASDREGVKVDRAGSSVWIRSEGSSLLWEFVRGQFRTTSPGANSRPIP